MVAVSPIHSAPSADCNLLIAKFKTPCCQLTWHALTEVANHVTNGWDKQLMKSREVYRSAHERIGKVTCSKQCCNNQQLMQSTKICRYSESKHPPCVVLDVVTVKRRHPLYKCWYCHQSTRRQ